MACPDKEIALITCGRQRGIGRGILRQVLRDHGQRFHVLIGSRKQNTDGDAAVKELQGEGYGEAVEAVQVIDEGSLAAAAKLVSDKFGRLDVLHANAEISGYRDYANRPLSETILLAVKTNAAGAAATVENFMPLLSKADSLRVIFMSSGAGSLKLANDFRFVEEYPAYCVSKATENMIMLYYHHRNPGFRATEINNYRESSGETPGPISEGAFNAVRLTLLGKDRESDTHTT